VTEIGAPITVVIGLRFGNKPKLLLNMPVPKNRGGQKPNNFLIRHYKITHKKSNKLKLLLE
jgi:hypothetical protein